MAAAKAAETKASWKASQSGTSAAAGAFSGRHNACGYQEVSWSQAWKWSTTPDASSTWANCPAAWGGR